MGEFSDAYAFIDRNMIVEALNDKPIVHGFQGARQEMAIKSYLAGRDGLKVNARELNEKYEITMKLVPRKTPLSEEGLQILNKLDASGLLIEPDQRAKRKK